MKTLKTFLWQRYSSALTDDESHNAHTNSNGTEKTIGTVFDHKKVSANVGVPVKLVACIIYVTANYMEY